MLSERARVGDKDLDNGTPDLTRPLLRLYIICRVVGVRSPDSRFGRGIREPSQHRQIGMLLRRPKETSSRQV
jgi:hypothetical protein